MDPLTERGSLQRGERHVAQTDPQAETAQTKLERIKLKNNKAQKKYRVKKQYTAAFAKKIVPQEEKRALEHSVSELSALISKAESERNLLHGQVKVLQFRMDPSIAEVAGIVAQRPQQKAELRCTLEIQDQELFYHPAAEGYDGLEPLLKQGLILSATFHPPRKWSHDEFLRLTLQDHCDTWKEMVLKASQLLLSNPERDPECAEGRQLKELVTELHGYKAYLAEMQPVLTHHLMDCRADACNLPAELPGSDFWSNILGKLRLSEQQQEALLQMYSSSNDAMNALLASRESLRRSLLAEAVEDSAAGYTEDNRQAFDYVRWASLVRAAQDNWDTLHIEMSKFSFKSGSLWGFNERVTTKGLDIFQDAQLLTLAWPYFPCRFRLVAELARRKGQGWSVGFDEASLTLGDIPDCSEDPYKTVPEKMLEAYMQEVLTLTDV